MICTPYREADDNLVIGMQHTAEAAMQPEPTPNATELHKHVLNPLATKYCFVCSLTRKKITVVSKSFLKFL
jgi:hypothetical protein